MSSDSALAERLSALEALLTVTPASVGALPDAVFVALAEAHDAIESAAFLTLRPWSWMAGGEGAVRYAVRGDGHVLFRLWADLPPTYISLVCKLPLTTFDFRLPVSTPFLTVMATADAILTFAGVRLIGATPTELPR